MVPRMQVVIATAEPRAAYHLEPLRQALSMSSSSYTHLVPYPEPVQGEPVVEVASTTSIMDRADRVVITGGTLNPWTELVAREANRRQVPVLYSELAWATATPYAATPELAGASALSPAEAPRIAAMLGVNAASVVVTGIPALDNLPAYRPLPNTALVLSTVDMLDRDPDHVLLDAALEMQAAGWRVRVRCHPREDRQPWEGFEIVEGESQTESASTAAVVVGYPGSAHVLAAATGAPVISVEPNDGFSGILSAGEAALTSARLTRREDLITAVRSATPCDPSMLAEVVGPLDGASARLVAFWEA